MGGIISFLFGGSERLLERGIEDGTERIAERTTEHISEGLLPRLGSRLTDPRVVATGVGLVAVSPAIPGVRNWFGAQSDRLTEQANETIQQTRAREAQRRAREQAVDQQALNSGLAPDQAAIRALREQFNDAGGLGLAPERFLVALRDYKDYEKQARSRGETAQPFGQWAAMWVSEDQKPFLAKLLANIGMGTGLGAAGGAIVGYLAGGPWMAVAGGLTGAAGGTLLATYSGNGQKTFSSTTPSNKGVTLTTPELDLAMPTSLTPSYTPAVTVTRPVEVATSGP